MKSKTKKSIVIAFLIFSCLLLIIPHLLRLCPFLVGMDSSFIIMGGSMKPTLNPGDVIFTKEVETTEIDVDDIVSVKTDSGIYTHRIVEKLESNDEVIFKLKGDANEDPDQKLVLGSEIIGKIFFLLPTSYLYTKIGFVITVLTPLLVLAIYQFINIYRFYDIKKQNMNVEKTIKFPVIDTIGILLLLILAVAFFNMMIPHLTSGSQCYFMETEFVSSKVNAGIWLISTL